MARPLKIFTVQSHASFAPYGALMALGVPRHIQQATMYVAAYNKPDAARLLNEAGAQLISPRHICEARGYCFEALRDSTDVLKVEGAIAVMWNRSASGGKVAIRRNGNWAVIGEVTYKDPGDDRKMLDRPIFILGGAPAKPVRLIIELDANTDPRVIETFRAGLSVLIASGVNDKATGTVIEP